MFIEQELQRQFHQLAKDMHRTESEIIHKALATDHHFVEVLKQRITAADRGEFANEEDVKFFLQSVVSNGTALA